MKLAVSIGDINGIGFEILLKAHLELCKICEPFYFIHENLFKKASKLLHLELKNANLVCFKNAKKYDFKFLKSKNSINFYSFSLPLDFEVDENFDIKSGIIDKKSGIYSFLSFKAASYFTYKNHANALLTLPIHKKAWEEAGLVYKGHTDALRAFFKKNAIMMLGCKELFVGLFTEHIALKNVSKKIKFESLSLFLIDFYKATKFKKIGVLAFNPHASDYGAIGGDEELVIKKAINFANGFLASKKDENFFKKALKDENLQKKLCEISANIYLAEPLVADTAFTKEGLKRCKRLVCMYHDLALAPLKALYFEKSINVSLNLPIIRVSVDHGTAFDKAYKNAKISTKSYIEAAKFALNLHKIK